MKKIFLIIFLVATTTTFKIIKSEYLLESNNICHQINDRQKCIGLLKHQCDDYCTLDQKSCQILSKIIAMIRSKTKMIYSLNRSKEFQEFVKNIKKCPSSNTSSSLIQSSYDVCIKKNDCMIEEVVHVFHRYVINTKCPCIGRYGYNCGENYCAVSKKDCNKMKTTHLDQRKSISYCLSKRKILEKKN